MCQVRNDRERGNRRERILQHWAPNGVVDDVRVHAVVDDLAVDVTDRPLRCGARASGRLPDYVREKDVGVRIHVGRQEAGLEGGRAKSCRARNWEWCRVDESGCGGGRTAVRRVADGGADRIAGDGDGEVRLVETAIVAEPCIGDEAIEGFAVERPGSR